MIPEAEVPFFFIGSFEAVESSFKQKPVFTNIPRFFITRILLSYWLHFPNDQNANNEACTNEINRFVAPPAAINLKIPL